MTEVTKLEPAKVKTTLTGSSKIKVKNISKRPINLTSGCLKAGAEGTATVAEQVVHESIIEKI